MKLKCIFLVVLGLLISDAALAMRCGRYSIIIGDRKDEVLNRCGDPESAESHNKLVALSVQDPTHTLAIQQYEEIKIDEWIYNLGPMHFKQYLRFENSILKETRDLERGS